MIFYGLNIEILKWYSIICLKSNVLNRDYIFF